MNKLQLIGHKPTIKNTVTGQRKSFTDYQQLCEYINKNKVYVSGLEQMPEYFQSLVNHVAPDPTPAHIIQLTEGGIS